MNPRLPCLLMLSLGLVACDRTASVTEPATDAGEVTATPTDAETVPLASSPWDAARERGIGFRGVGNEPGWSVEVAMGEAPAMHLSLDYGERMLEVAQSQPLADAVGFAGTADDGSAVKLVIVREDCSDGMSDQIYPASAMLGVGDREYRGCGRFLFD